VLGAFQGLLLKCCHTKNYLLQTFAETMKGKPSKIDQLNEAFGLFSIIFLFERTYFVRTYFLQKAVQNSYDKQFDSSSISFYFK